MYIVLFCDLGLIPGKSKEFLYLDLFFILFEIFHAIQFDYGLHLT